MPFNFSWSNVNLAGVGIAGLQVLVGGVVTYCKLWIPTEENLRESVDLKREALRESVSKRLHSLLNVAVASMSTELRGSPPQTPDHVGDFTMEFFRVAGVFREIDRLYSRIRAGHSYLLLTVLAGVLLLLLSLVYPDSASFVGVVCPVVILSQLICIIYLRKVAQRFEEYERTT